jgi:hypothetical protein
MVDEWLGDWPSLDRDVARAWRALAHWRAQLTKDLTAMAGEEPLEAVRHVGGRTTWRALAELTPADADMPLRDALKRWVFFFIQARIGLPLEVAWARAATEKRAVLQGDLESRVSWLEAWRGVASARSTAETQRWLQAAADVGPDVAAVNRLRAERRVEVAHRLGVDHPWAPILPVDRGALRNAAELLLIRTDDLAAAARSRGPSAEEGPSAVIHGAMARDASEGWPAHLTSHWLQDAFGSGTRGLPLQLPPLPAARGASSFARALVAFGFAVRVAASPSDMPFALARDPAFVSAHRLGFVFGTLALDAHWQERTLCIGRRVAAAQSIALSRSALLEARLLAARLLLGDEAAFAPLERFNELGVRLFGRELDARLRGAWPLAREDEPARFLALLEGLPLAESLREQFDVDWYRNPRAWVHLRALAAGPAREPAEASALPHQVDRLARAFEGVLG